MVCSSKLFLCLFSNLQIMSLLFGSCYRNLVTLLPGKLRTTPSCLFSLGASAELPNVNPTPVYIWTSGCWAVINYIVIWFDWLFTFSKGLLCSGKTLNQNVFCCSKTILSLVNISLYKQITCLGSESSFSENILRYQTNLMDMLLSKTLNLTGF